MSAAAAFSTINPAGAAACASEIQRVFEAQAATALKLRSSSVPERIHDLGRGQVTG